MMETSSDDSGEVYNNLACAECNGVPPHELSCLPLRSRDEVPEQCIPMTVTTIPTSPIITIPPSP